MALIKCDECGKDVSSKAMSCPNCGNPVSTSSKNEYSVHRESGGFVTFIKNGVLIFFAGVLFYSTWKGIISGELLFEDPYTLPFKIFKIFFSTLGNIINHFLA